MSTTVEPAAGGSHTHRFQAEVSQVLSLVINSLYSHREIFLRELISNASDALDRLRYRAQTDHDLVDADAPREIRLVPDRDAGTLTVEDFGLGMTEAELHENLGTVAHSGTRAFQQALAAAKEHAGDLSLIGQFGVGFYSAFLVADRVTVVTRAAGAGEAWRWSSDAHDTYEVEPAERATHGTAVTLHLKEDARDLLDTWRLRELVARYSDYISYPIRCPEERPAEPAGDEGEAPEEAPGWQQLNEGSALWQRPRAEIPDEEYRQFYQHLTHDWEEPLAWTHFKIEGMRQFTGLLFVPSRPPFDLFLPEPKHGVRLYVKRVFIMDDCDALLPRWLRFVRGVVDSDDLPLNVSRELLQDSATVRAIRKQVTKKALELLEQVAAERPEDYASLWERFGVVLKEGLHLAPEHKDALAELVRFRSSATDGWRSLAQAVEAMPEGQEAIYYALAPTREAAAASPHLEALRKRGYEVLYMTDAIDEWAVTALGAYRDKPLVSAMKADLTLAPEEAAAHEERKAALSGLLERFEAVLGDKVAGVRPSTRLEDSPACLVVPEGGLHAHVERLLRATERTVHLPEQKRILEVHPTHPLVERLRALHEADGESAEVAEWIGLLYDQALLAEGSLPHDPAALATRLTRLMGRALGVEAARPAGEEA